MKFSFDVSVSVSCCSESLDKLELLSEFSREKNFANEITRRERSHCVYIRIITYRRLVV